MPTHCRQAKGIICMEHCDACQYLEVAQGTCIANIQGKKRLLIKASPFMYVNYVTPPKVIISYMER